MKISTKFILSSIVISGLIVFFLGGSKIIIHNKEVLVNNEADKLMNMYHVSYDLELLLAEQVLSLKDFLLLGRKASDIEKYYNKKSNFQLTLDELENLFNKLENQDSEISEIKLIRRRYKNLATLVDQINDQETSLEQIQLDLQSINSFQQDIKFHLDILNDKIAQEINNAIIDLDHFHHQVIFVEILTISIIFLIVIIQFKIILFPFIKSFKLLEEGTKKIGEGNLDYKLDIKTGDEIEQIAVEFNIMTNKLSSLYHSLDTKTKQLSKTNEELQEEIEERITIEEVLKETLSELKNTQVQMIQNEKMSSLGKMVAGVAHEINNPVNFIYGNVTHAQECINDLLELIKLYITYYPEPHDDILDEIEAIDLDFLMDDIPKLLDSMRVGANRIQKIVLSLRTFSHLDESEMKKVDLHEGIESTLLILQNRLKAQLDHPEIKVIKNYDNLPLVDCYASQLNQVFMNILANSIDAIKERNENLSFEEIKAKNNAININTNLIKKNEEDWIEIKLSDNGLGMNEETKKHLFDPFYTTKEVGKGTGLGLSISHSIIVEQHQGSLQCISEVGQGTTFIIKIPAHQS